MEGARWRRCTVRHLQGARRRRQRGLRGDQANFDDYAAAPSEFSDEGDRVVVRGRFTGRNKNGAELATDFEHVFEMRDGKVVRFENKPADAAAWAVGWGG
jgi:ketosteroid isomerase-like protein